MVKPHSTITGEIITVVNKTVSTVTPALVLFQQNKEISKELEKLRLLVQSLKNIQEMQVQQETEEKGKEEKTKKTKEELKNLTKDLNNEFETLLKDVKGLNNIITNFKKLENIINIIQKILEEKLNWIIAHSKDIGKIKKEEIIKNIEGTLDVLSEDLKKEERMGNKENIQLLRKFINGERDLDAFMAKFIKHIEDLHTFVESLEKNSKSREQLHEVVLLLSQIQVDYNSLSQKQLALKKNLQIIGQFEDKRKGIEEDVLRGIEHMKTAMKMLEDAQFVERISNWVANFKKKILSTERGDESIANCDKGIIGAMQEIQGDISALLNILTQFEAPLKNIEKLLR